MTWWSTALDWAANTAENETVKGVASAAVGVASTYMLSQMMAPSVTPSKTESSILSLDDSASQKAVEAANKQSEKNTKARKGYQSTILTGPAGLQDQMANLKRKTLLGE